MQHPIKKFERTNRNSLAWSNVVVWHDSNRIQWLNCKPRSRATIMLSMHETKFWSWKSQCRLLVIWPQSSWCFKATFTKVYYRKVQMSLCFKWFWSFVMTMPGMPVNLVNAQSKAKKLRRKEKWSWLEQLSIFYFQNSGQPCFSTSLKHKTLAHP